MNTTLTREHLATWLAAVHEDSELSARAFKVAFALSQAADPTGFVRSGALAKFASCDQIDAEPVAGVLGRLATRGHIEGFSKRKVEGYRIVVPNTKASVARRAKAASVLPFPAARRGAFVHKQAARMATLSQTQAEAHLRQQLRIQTEAMRRRRIAEEIIAREIRSVESAIRAELWRCIFAPGKA